MFPLRERQDFPPARDAALHVLRDAGALDGARPTLGRRPFVGPSAGRGDADS